MSCDKGHVVDMVGEVTGRIAAHAFSETDRPGEAEEPAAEADSEASESESDECEGAAGGVVTAYQFIGIFLDGTASQDLSCGS